jgi:hypothetical protein
MKKTILSGMIGAMALAGAPKANADCCWAVGGAILGGMALGATLTSACYPPPPPPMVYLPPPPVFLPPPAVLVRPAPVVVRHHAPVVMHRPVYVAPAPVAYMPAARVVVRPGVRVWAGAGCW